RGRGCAHRETARFTREEFPMFSISRLIVAAVVTFFFCSGSFGAVHQRDGPISWRAIMADENKVPNVLERAVPAKPPTQVIKVRLDEVVLRPEDFSPRAPAAFTRDALRPLTNSILAAGLRHPPEVYREGDRFIVITGHRRVTVLRFLAEDGISGFSLDM